MWMEQSSQSLDAATARFFRLVSQVRLERRPHGRPNICREPLEVSDGFRSKDDLERHSGQTIANLEFRSNDCPGSQHMRLDRPTILTSDGGEFGERTTLVNDVKHRLGRREPSARVIDKRDPSRRLCSPLDDKANCGCLIFFCARTDSGQARGERWRSNGRAEDIAACCGVSGAPGEIRTPGP